MLDETEDEQNLRENILKNKKRRLQGQRPLIITNKVRKIDNDIIDREDCNANQENSQDPDNVVHKSEFLIPE